MDGLLLASEYASQGVSTGQIITSSLSGILSIVGMWMVFSKAGEAGWKAIIPFLNLYTLFKIAWGKGWMFLWILFFPVFIVVYIINNWKLAKAFGQSAGIGVLCIFLPTIAYLVLGFGNAEYIGPQ